MQLEVRPFGLLSAAFQAEWTSAFGFAGERAKRIADFLRLDAAADADGADVMPVEPFRQSPQDGLIGVGRDAFDDQLTPGHAEGDHRPVLEQPIGTTNDVLDRRPKGRMPAWVHRVSMKRDGQLDEKVAELTRQNAAF